MIYLDSSVVIAELLSEDRAPSPRLWENSLIASRLVHYEVFTRLHRAGLGSSHRQAASALLERMAVIEMAPSVLERALEPFPFPLRTLDALHLATLDFVAGSGNDVALASYDMRLIECARAMDFAVEEL